MLLADVLACLLACLRVCCSFYFDGLDFGWSAVNWVDANAKSYKDPDASGDVDTAMGLMHHLRTLGIRAHFWI
jgi:hypothetical protein